MVRIRMKRMGRKHRPFYRINAVEKRTQRDGKVLENLGWYNPVDPVAERQISLKAERIQHWLGLGATASDTVKDLLAKEGLIDADAWKAERESRIAKKRAASIAAAEAAKKKAEEEAAAAAAAEAEAAKAKAEAEAAAAAEAPAEGE